MLTKKEIRELAEAEARKWRQSSRMTVIDAIKAGISAAFAKDEQQRKAKQAKKPLATVSRECYTCDYRDSSVRQYPCRTCVGYNKWKPAAIRKGHHAN